MFLPRWPGPMALVLVSTLTATVHAKTTTYISGTSLDGVTNNRLAVDRKPALYTGDFGDCLGGQSLLNVTKFDAAFYYDNSTILFHLDGATNLKSEALMCKHHLIMAGTTSCGPKSDVKQCTSLSRHTDNPGLPWPSTRVLSTSTVCAR